jgi:hypothetical protein
VQIDAFLADSVVHADGKLFALGAGWDQLTANGFPARHPRLSIGVIITVPYSDTDSGHELRIRMEDADGAVLPIGGQAPPPGEPDTRTRMIKAQLPRTRTEERRSGDERVVALAINLDGLIFEAPGRYRFVLDLEGAPQKRLAFRVVPSPGG